MGKYGIMAGKSIIGKFWDICICGDKDKKPKSFFAPLQTINVKLQIASEVVTTHWVERASLSSRFFQEKNILTMEIGIELTKRGVCFRFTSDH